MTATQEKAGARLYKETLAHYQLMRDHAEHNMQVCACNFLDSKDPDEEARYKAAKASMDAWDGAMQVLTKNGGDWLRLDFPQT